MMNCDKAKELLSDYLDGILEPGQKEQIDQFLKTDEECNELFEQARLIKVQFNKLPKVYASEKFDSNLRERIIKLNKGEGIQSRFSVKGLSIALSGALVLAVLYMFTITDFNTQNPGKNEVVPASNGNNTQPVNVIVDNNESIEKAKESDTTTDSLKNEPEEVDNSKIKLTGDK